MRRSRRHVSLLLLILVAAPVAAVAATAELRLDPTTGGLEGRATLDGTGPELRLRLAPGLAVAEARSGGRPAPFARQGQGAGACPVAEQMARSILTLPMYPELTEEQVAHVADSVNAFPD